MVMSQVLMKPSDPRAMAKTRKRGQLALNQATPGDCADTMSSRHIAMVSREKGSAMRWGWRSAKRKLKAGNSVMV